MRSLVKDELAAQKATAWAEKTAQQAAADADKRVASDLAQNSAALFSAVQGTIDIEDGAVVYRFRRGSAVQRYEIASLVGVRHVPTELGFELAFFNSGGSLSQAMEAASLRNAFAAFLAKVVELNPSIELSREAGWWPASAVQARQATQARAPEVQIKSYKDAKAYERDAGTMLAQGWRMEGQSGTQGKVRMGRTVLKAGVFLPWAVMRPSRKGDPITVTWLRGGDLVEVQAPPVQPPQPLAAPAGDDVPAQIRKLATTRLGDTDRRGIRCQEGRATGSHVISEAGAVPAVFGL